MDTGEISFRVSKLAFYEIFVLFRPINSIIQQTKLISL